MITASCPEDRMKSKDISKELVPLENKTADLNKQWIHGNYTGPVVCWIVILKEKLDTLLPPQILFREEQFLRKMQKKVPLNYRDMYLIFPLLSESLGMVSF